MNLPIPQDFPDKKPKFPRGDYQEFRKAYGNLWGPDYPLTDYYELVQAFRSHWTAETEAQKQRLVSFVEKLLTDRLRPALPIAAGMTLASQVGSVRVPVEMLVELLTARRGPRDFEPRTLLDYLAVWLLVFRRQGKLAVCKRKDCKRFFVKAHPRYRYCSTDCSDEIRKAGKALWFRNNRGASTKITAKKRNLARK